MVFFILGSPNARQKSSDHILRQDVASLGTTRVPELVSLPLLFFLLGAALTFAIAYPMLTNQSESVYTPPIFQQASPQVPLPPLGLPQNPSASE